VGNHVDSHVLGRLVAEQLPPVAARMASLDVSCQLLTARWFLCLWSSVLSPAALLRAWDILFARL
jgi:hypothetical protein